MKAATLAKRLGMSPQGRTEWARDFGLLQTGSEATALDVAEHTVLQDLKLARVWGDDAKLAFRVARKAINPDHSGPLFLVMRESGEHVVCDSYGAVSEAAKGGQRVRVFDLEASIERARQIWNSSQEAENLTGSQHGRVSDLDDVRRRRASR